MEELLAPPSGDDDDDDDEESEPEIEAFSPLAEYSQKAASSSRRGVFATPREGRLERGRGGDRYLLGQGGWFNVETAFGVKEPGVETGKEVLVRRC